MQREKRIASVLRQIKEISKNESSNDPYTVAAFVLEWVLDKEMDISEVIPEIKLYEKPRDKDLFDSNKKKRYVWFSPVLSEWIWEPKLPKHTPQRWWTEVSDNELMGLEAMSGADLDKGYLKHLPSIEESMEQLGEPFKLHWSQIDTFYETYRDLFRNRNEVEKFLSNDFEIDNKTKVEYAPEDRAKIHDEEGILFNRIKKHLLQKEQLVFIYEYKKRGKIMWVFHDKKENLDEENYYGFR